MMIPELSFVSLLTPLLCLLMIGRSISLFSQRKQSGREFLLWLMFWLGIGFVALYPGVLDLLPPIIGIKSGVNALIFFGFVVLFYAVSRLVMKVEELEGKLVQMNRKKALKEAEKEEFC